MVIALIGVAFLLTSGDDEPSTTETAGTENATLDDAVDAARRAGLADEISDARAAALIERICDAAEDPSEVDELGGDLAALPAATTTELRQQISALGEGAERRCAVRPRRRARPDRRPPGPGRGGVLHHHHRADHPSRTAPAPRSPAARAPTGRHRRHHRQDGHHQEGHHRHHGKPDHHDHAARRGRGVSCASAGARGSSGDGRGGPLDLHATAASLHHRASSRWQSKPCTPAQTTPARRTQRATADRRRRRRLPRRRRRALVGLDRAGGRSGTVSLPLRGRIAQLVRALPSHGRGQGFESLCAHHSAPVSASGGTVLRVRGRRPSRASIPRPDLRVYSPRQQPRGVRAVAGSAEGVMRKRTVGIALATALLGVVPLSAGPAGAVDVTLWDQAIPADNALSSSTATSEPEFASQSASDFIVPADQTWTINSIDLGGFDVTGEDVSQYNVRIYADAGGEVGALETEELGAAGTGGPGAPESGVDRLEPWARRRSRHALGEHPERVGDPELGLDGVVHADRSAPRTSGSTLAVGSSPAGAASTGATTPSWPTSATSSWARLRRSAR